jgi:hypothetical protein
MSAARNTAITLGIIWTSPNTMLGIVIGCVGFLFGGDVQWRRKELALVFRHLPWAPGGALTLGNVILYTGNELDSPCHTYAHRAGMGSEPAISLADHERAHVYQYLALGPLFLPIYFMCGGVSVRNRFERAADRYARTGHGWWPWDE